MKLKPNLISAVFFVSLLISNPANCQSHRPSDSWEQLSEGIRLVLGIADNRVTIAITNSSNSPKVLIAKHPDMPIQLFYISDQGVKTSLGTHHRAVTPENTVVERNASSTTIPSGGEMAITMAIPITSDEMALVKTHAVICSLLIYDPGTKQTFTVESSPKRLTGGT